MVLTKVRIHGGRARSQMLQTAALGANLRWQNGTVLNGLGLSEALRSAVDDLAERDAELAIGNDQTAACHQAV